MLTPHIVEWASTYLIVMGLLCTLMSVTGLVLMILEGEEE